MEKRLLEIKEFHIHKKRDKINHLKLEEIALYDELKQGFVAYLNIYEQRYNQSKPIKQTRIISIAKDNHGNIVDYNDNMFYICGKIDYGYYGQDGSILNQSKIEVFHKETTHAMPKPFFFLIMANNDSKKGYIITEKDGQQGISGQLNNVLRGFIQNLDNTISFKSQNYIERDVIQNFINNGIFEEISLSSHLNSESTEDNYDSVGISSEQKYKVELKIVSKDKNTGVIGRIVDYIKSVYNNESNSQNRGALPEAMEMIGFDEYSRIKVKSQHNNNTRTIVIDKSHTIRPYYEIEVDDNSNGHVNFNSIREATIETLRELNILQNE